MPKIKTTTQNSKFYDLVYRFVRRIPVGRITTYGEIARQLIVKSEKSKVDPRIVGWALHANRDPKVPCHRVVDRNGRLAPNFAFDGAVEQRRRLEEEGVEFATRMQVRLSKYLWHFDRKSEVRNQKH